MDSDRCLRLLACYREQAGSSTIFSRYSQQFAALLQADLHWHALKQSPPLTLSAQLQSQYDLLLVNEDDTSPEKVAAKQLAMLPQPTPRQPAMLLVRQAKWPLQHLLLIIRGEATDKATIEWGLRLTKLAQTRLTLLVVVPPLPLGREPPIANVLKSNTISGHHIRTILQQLARNQIDGVLKVSHRSPEHQVKLEIESAPYDLVILGREPKSHLYHWRLDSLLKPILDWFQQSVLITGCTSPFEAQTAAGGEVDDIK